MSRKVHIVKCVSPHFEEVWEERKPFEVRKDDRDYQPSDVIVLRHWDPARGYDGQRRSLIFRIGSVLRDFPGLRKGHCAFGLLAPTDKDLGLADLALSVERQP